MKLLVCFSFLGTFYCGFQAQPNGMTVQRRLTEAAQSLFGTYCPVTGCSRTDSGVHANRFYCTIDVSAAPNQIAADKVCDALNHFLPDDISAISARTVSDDFHPRYSAKRKEYKYLIWNERARNPFLTGRAYHRPKPLDAMLMDEAAKCFIGVHDFEGFCAAGSSVADTTREIFAAECTRDGGLVAFTVQGNGFLYNMVRILVGTLIEVSNSRIKVSELPMIIESRDRSRAGFTAPPHGLYLNDVIYG